MTNSIECGLCGAVTQPDEPCPGCGFVTSAPSTELKMRVSEITPAEGHYFEMQEVLCAAFAKRGKATYFVDGCTPMNLGSAQQWLHRAILDQGKTVSAMTELTEDGTSTYLSATGPGPN